MALTKYPSAEAREWWDNFKKLLDDNNDWPGEYVFKFIAPKQQIEKLVALFEGHDMDIKASSKGKYQSITSRVKVKSSDEIVSYYLQAGAIEGVISL